ncbi:TY-Chap domain-containing protein [Gordonia neofelifaecis]|uniref:TY-Chap N-terminal domain-containing protein n=1 Tax=Gordonia neofelifaecis NRRL B-59395 TaxID=644548 RepID=F1YL10_9ACTN|nr:hypothetical protein [Gordonia neofelifaecis]EGD54615.1 hypothetical protein SCNU_13573 [Gordonia neofelifaecis NRRL B-59395]
MADASDVFSESAFDAAIDRVWVRFRCELADQLDRLRSGHPITVYALWTEMFGPQPTIVFTHTGNNRLRLTVADCDLYPYGPEDQDRIDMLIADGWRSLRDGTCIREFAQRRVDAAAMCAQYALREVWGVPDPSYLVSDNDDVLRTFITPHAAAREPKMR